MESSPVGSGKRSIWPIIRRILRHAFGSALEIVHAPAKIKEFEYIDPITNETVYLSTGARYSVLHVGVKRFFFDRVTGRFDGTGELLQERVADGLELLN
jgi:hypothetical protein